MSAHWLEDAVDGCGDGGLEVAGVHSTRQVVRLQHGKVRVHHSLLLQSPNNHKINKMPSNKNVKFKKRRKGTNGLTDLADVDGDGAVEADDDVLGVIQNWVLVDHLRRTIRFLHLQQHNSQSMANTHTHSKIPFENNMFMLDKKYRHRNIDR